uniref:Putative secreted protein n=1 Tax=Ixodes ricinus TaxID=34613 RepID=A0A6B0TXG1_IXORI
MPTMEWRGITLVLVSLTFFGSAAAETCRNGTRPASVKVQVSCITKKRANSGLQRKARILSTPKWCQIDL